MRAHRWTGLLALLLVVPLGHASGAAVKPVAVAPLAGATAITWSGVAGLRLGVAKTVEFPAEKIRLFPTAKTTYAVAVFVPSPMPAGACPTGVRICAVTQIAWFRDLAETGGNTLRPPPYDAPTDHVTIAGSPHRVAKGGWDAYLFTDGTVTMEIDVPGLAGRAAYRATGRVTGAMTRMQASCPVSACSAQRGIADRYGYGSTSVATGALGWAQSLVYVQNKGSTTAVVGHNQPMLNRACVYPGVSDPDASPDPADHPTGCDYVPADSTATADWTQGTYDELVLGAIAISRITLVANPEVTGKALAGFHLGAADPYPAALGATTSRSGAYALSFAYGIR